MLILWKACYCILMALMRKYIEHDILFYIRSIRYRMMSNLDPSLSLSLINSPLNKVKGIPTQLSLKKTARQRGISQLINFNGNVLDYGIHWQSRECDVHLKKKQTTTHFWFVFCSTTLTRDNFSCIVYIFELLSCEFVPFSPFRPCAELLIL